jgi:hypothetical protein
MSSLTLKKKITTKAFINFADGTAVSSIGIRFADILCDCSGGRESLFSLLNKLEIIDNKFK